MKTVLRISMALAVVGLAVGLGIHVRALFGWGLRFRVLETMTLGIFILSLPYAWVVMKLRSKLNVRFVGVADLYRSSPRWMVKTGYVLFGYFLLVMVVFAAKTHGDQLDSVISVVISQAEALFFSSGWMIGYFALFEIFFSALKTVPWPSRCTNGHLVASGRGYCEECGALVRAKNGNRL